MALTLAGFPQFLPHFIAPVQGAVTWNSPSPVEKYIGNNLQPAALQASNGTAWLVWGSDRRGGIGSGRNDIFYKTMTNGIWSLPTPLTNTGHETTPAITQLANSTIILIWASNQTLDYHLVYKRFNALRGTWFPTTQLTSPPSGSQDSSPSASLSRDGTLWLFWNRENPVTSDNQLYYKTLSNGVWSTETKFTTDTNWNWQPSVLVGKDGTVRVSWTRGPLGSNYQIWYNTYSGGVWGTMRQIVSSTLPDTRPSLAQDRDGTIWVFWERTTPVGVFFNHDIYSKYSVDNGATWTSDAQMTFDWGGFVFIDQQPAAIQSLQDKSLWVFYSTNTGNTGEFDIYALKSSRITPVHDVGITGLSPLSNQQYPGGLISVQMSPNVTIFVYLSNFGDFNETVTVTLTATNSTNAVIGTVTDFVRNGTSDTLLFTWVTTSTTKPARYGLSATMPPVSGQSLGNQGNDSLSLKNQIWMLPLGDVDQDGAVTITDVGVVYYNFGFSVGSPRYNPFADVHGTGTIDIIDVGIVSKNYGTYT